MQTATFWTCCVQAFEAIGSNRFDDAEQHLAAARDELASNGASSQDPRRAVLQRYETLLAGRRPPTAPLAADVTARMRGVPAVSLVTSVFNRFWQLQQTLPGNLSTIRDQPDIDLVLVDFGGADSAEIQTFIEREFAFDLLSGKLKYFVARVPWTRFHMATAKNVAHRLSAGSFVFSLDADNHFQAEDLAVLRAHCRNHPGAVLHQTTGPAPMRHRMWSKYGLFDDDSAYHGLDPSWDGSCGRIGISREAFERVNGYNENFVGMGMDDIDFLMRSMRAGAGYHHVGITREAAQVFIDNGSADIAHQHENNQQNWQRMDEALAQGRLVPLYQTDSPPERFSQHVPRLVERSASARVTLFSSLFRVAPYLERFLNDLRQITRTPGVCVWLFDVVGSHDREVSAALRSAADGETVFYVPVLRDPGLYALWNTAIASIGSPFLGNLNADDLRGAGWLPACLDPLEAGLADIASPVTVPFEDPRVVDHGAALAQLRANGQREPRWFDSRVVVSGSFPDERPQHQPLIDGAYTQQDLFQVLPDGRLASYCIPNASAVWSQRVHALAGEFDEPRYGAFADLALWAHAGASGLRFRQVAYPALFFISEQQAHRRQAHNEDKLVQLALRHGAPAVQQWTSRRQFDLSRIGGSYGDHHFMGWNWVRDEIAAHFRHTTPRTLLDVFVERNFFWNQNPGEDDFVFRRPWLGFVHTTPHSSAAFDNKGQNLDALLAEPRFQRSLNCCRGLIVLSELNQQYLRQQLRSSHGDVPVYRLFHPNVPMPAPAEPCSVELRTAKGPKIFHVGWHLRSFSAFARLRVERKRKVLLVPKKLPMDYFLRDVVDKELRLQGLGPAETHFGEIYSASQTDYAHILREAVVFNHYLQPAGSNLISECISAGTRLVINRHPAFEQYLGTDYPLFYDSLDEADARVSLASSPASAELLQQHLAQLQQRWSIKQFCRDLARIGEDAHARG